jgi:hypothetical protein
MENNYHVWFVLNVLTGPILGGAGSKAAVRPAVCCCMYVDNSSAGPYKHGPNLSNWFKAGPVY